MDALYRRHYSAVLLYCTALCGDPHLAQDIAADAFVKAYLSLPNETPSFRYWLLRVCKNLWLDHLRRQRHLASEDALQAMSDGITPESRYLQDEQHRALWKALAGLAPQDRELVILHYFSGLSLQDAAHLLHITYPAARQRIHRLRQTLKKRMEEQGYGQTE